MKKILITLCIAFFSVSAAFADMYNNCIYIPSNAVEAAITSLVPTQNQANAASQYEILMDPNTGCIPVFAFYRVCVFAGYDLDKRGGFNDCQTLLQTMIAIAGLTGDGNDDCIVNKDGIWTTNADGKKECVDKEGYVLDYRNACMNAKNIYKSFGLDASYIDDSSPNNFDGVCYKAFRNVTMAYATAKGAIQSKYNVSCLNRTTLKQEEGSYLLCSAKGKPYTFEFKSFKDNDDANFSLGNIAEMACRLSKSNYRAMGVTYGDIWSPNHGAICVRENDNRDVILRDYIESKDCSGINQFVQKLAPGLQAGLGNQAVLIPDGLHPAVPIRGLCVIHGNRLGDSGVRNDLSSYGINSYEFVNLEELRNSEDVIETIRKYIRSKMGKDNVLSVECDIASRKLYTSTDVFGFSHDQKDVIGCTVNGNKRVDFVFKQLNKSGTYIWASSDSYVKSGLQGLECLAADGTFDGRNCRLLGKENCEQLQNTLKTSCPTCTQPRWDGETCVLPDATEIAKIQRAIKIVSTTGKIVAGTVLAVVPGTQGAGLALLGTVTSTVIIVGAATEITAEIVINTQVFGDFASEVEKCHDETCAERLITETVQKIQSYKSEFSDQEQQAVDELCAHLFAQIPATSDFWLQFLQNEDVFDPETCEIKEKEQFWQNVRTVGNVAQIIGGLMKVAPQGLNAMAEKTGKALRKKVLNKTKDVVMKKISEVILPGTQKQAGAMLSTLAGTAMATERAYKNSFIYNKLSGRTIPRFKVPQCLKGVVPYTSE